MKVIVRPRQAGKTYELVQWVKEGEKTTSYPFWSRVIIVGSIIEAGQLRKMHNLEYNQVYSFNEWQNAHLGAKPVELMFDNVDRILSRFAGGLNRIVGMTVTGEVDE